MKCKIPEISWHNRDPVLCVDLQPQLERGLQRLATGGTDSHVLIWYLSLNDETSELDLELAADLTRHQRAVNSVRWSPNGQLLASGDDESVIFIWKQKAESETLNILESTNEYDKEVWLTMKVLRGHMEDVYDVSWSPNSQFLVSGSVDNSAMIWDVHKGKSLAILSEHKGFVQGVAWDPRNQYIATLSTDRYLRIYDIQTKRVVQRINKSTLPVPEDHELHERRITLFHDDTLQTFFRRLCFTPDGQLLITPAGVADYDGATQVLHTSYIFSRHALRQPAIVLPSHDQYTVAVRCCPLLFRLRAHSETNKPVVPLPYRMIFAVATRCSVYFYDTQQRQPFAVISNIHYTRLTDVTWSCDGRIVVVSSTDGFCSLITFERGELGEEYEQTAAKLLSETQDVAQPLKKTKLQPKENSAAKSEAVPLVKTVLVPDIIIDKQILSTDDKFESPAKKAQRAMPIAVRRQPRTPLTDNNTRPSPANSPELKPNELMEVDNEKSTETTQADEIAIETKENAVETKETDVEMNEEKEEEIIPIPSTAQISPKSGKNVTEVDAVTEPVEPEDTQTGVVSPDRTVKSLTPRQNYQPPSERTPRRVQLITISTPKSKKKLLD